MIRNIIKLKNIIKKTLNETKFIMSQNKQNIKWYEFFYENLFCKNIDDNGNITPYKYLIIDDSSDKFDLDGNILLNQRYFDKKYYLVPYDQPLNVEEIDFSKRLKILRENGFNVNTLSLPYDDIIGLEIKNINDFNMKYKECYRLKISKEEEYFPQYLDAKSMSDVVEKKIKYIQINDRFKYKNTLYHLAGPDTFISFADPYEIDPVSFHYLSPKFSLNPNATFNTPHGFYFYHFDKKNAQRFYECGMPSHADFAIDRPYFHLVKIDLNNPNVLIFNKDGTSNRKMSSQEFIKNVKELIRIHINFFDKEINYKKIYNKLLNSYYALTKYNDNQILEENPLYQLYKFTFLLSSHNISRNNADKEKNFFVSELFSLLLHSIGIKCVVDHGTGTIHENEPEQMHIITFGDDTSFYKYIGTFDNIHNKFL